MLVKLVVDVAVAVEVDASAHANGTIGVVVRAEVGCNAEGLGGLPEKGRDGGGKGGGDAAMKLRPV